MKPALATLCATLLAALLITVSVTVSGADTQADAINARQTAFKTIKESMAEIKDAMSAENYDAASVAANKVLDNARAVTQLFPAGSYEGDTRAREKIWDNLEDFTQRQQKLIADVETMVNAAAAKDAKQLKAAFKETGSNCKGCHSKYRKLW